MLVSAEATVYKTIFGVSGKCSFFWTYNDLIVKFVKSVSILVSCD